jgi:hypothetical protein
MSTAIKAPAGQTVVQVASFYRSATTNLTTNPAETVLVTLDASTWREGMLLINITSLGASASLKVNVYNLDQQGNSYPGPQSNNGFISKTYAATGATRDTITAPMGSTIQITYSQTGLLSGTTTFTVEVQMKSA